MVLARVILIELFGDDFDLIGFGMTHAVPENNLFLSSWIVGWKHLVNVHVANVTASGKGSAWDEERKSSDQQEFLFAEFHMYFVLSKSRELSTILAFDTGTRDASHDVFTAEDEDK